MTVALSILVMAAATQADDWPTYRHDARRSGVTDAKINAPKLGQAWVWRPAAPPRPAWAGPAKWDAYAGIRGLRSMRDYDRAFHVAISAGRVTFGSSVDDAVRCLDASDGRQKWVFTTDAPVRAAPTIANGRAYFGSDDGRVYCVGASDGKEIWTFRPPAEAPLILHDGRFISLWPCRTGVLVDGGAAYFAFSMLPWRPSWICAVDATTGKERFSRKLDGPTLEGALVASADRLFASQGRIAPLLFNRADGKPIGSLKEGGGSFLSLTPDGLIVHGPGNKTGWLTASRPDSRAPVKKYGGRTAMVITGGKTVLLSDTRLTALDSKSQKTVWDVPSTFPHALIAAKDTLFAGGEDRVGAFSLSDGRKLWEAPVHGRAHGLAVIAGSLFVSTDTGALHCFREGAARSTSPRKIVVPRAAKPSGTTVAPARVTVAGLLDRWVFRTGMGDKARRRGQADAARRVANLAPGREGGRILGDVRLRHVGAVEALELDGAKNSVMIREDHSKAKLPTRKITAEAWVRIDKAQSWGGIVGAMQDNGNYERGWLLGFKGTKFAFAVAGKQGDGKLTYLTAKSDFETGVWHHVVGTYDGAAQKLYVDGKLQNSSSVQKGDVNYPPQAFYELGAYHDKDEYFRTQGMLHEVRVYSRALSAREAAAHFKEGEKKFPAPIRLAVGPWARFTGPDTAVVRWRTDRPSPTILEYDRGEVADRKPRKEHEVTLTGLGRDRIIEYVIKTPSGASPSFELDTHFNYSETPMAKGPDHPAVEKILKATGVREGICLVLGSGEGRLAHALAAATRLRVIGVDTDKGAIDRGRQALSKAGVYGARVALHHVKSLSKLPFTGNIANLVVSERAVNSREVTRLLRPDGGKAYRAGRVTERGPLKGAGEWSHQYGRADNTAFGGETLGMAGASTDFSVQWMGRPGPRAQPDRSGRKPSPLSTHGRLFVQGHHRMIGLDAYNGTILWSLEVPTMERFNIPRDSGNWCADDDFVYAAMRDRCWQIDAATGDVVRLHETASGGDHDWGYLARVGDRLIGSSIRKGTAHTNFWGDAGSGWYDSRSGPVTFKLCSEDLFALNPKTGRRAWTYQKGLILNSTISAGDGRLFFVECRNKQVLASSSRRVGMAELWKDQFLVAIDAKTGRRIWEKPIDTADGIVVFYVAYAEHRLVIVSSGDKKYDVYGFDASQGNQQWHNSFGWPGGKGDHGKAMSRPAIVGTKVYVRPMAFNLLTGKPLKERMPGGGCGTYAATAGSLIFRAGNVTLWNTQNGKTSSFNRLRPGCWLSTIPAGGMLLSPEAGGGCSCGKWMETSIGFMPRR